MFLLFLSIHTYIHTYFIVTSPKGLFRKVIKLNLINVNSLVSQ